MQQMQRLLLDHAADAAVALDEVNTDVEEGLQAEAAAEEEAARAIGVAAAKEAEEESTRAMGNRGSSSTDSSSNCSSSKGSSFMKMQCWLTVHKWLLKRSTHPALTWLGQLHQQLHEKLLLLKPFAFTTARKSSTLCIPSSASKSCRWLGDRAAPQACLAAARFVPRAPKAGRNLAGP